MPFRVSLKELGGEDAVCDTFEEFRLLLDYLGQAKSKKPKVAVKNTKPLSTVGSPPDRDTLMASFKNLDAADRKIILDVHRQGGKIKGDALQNLYRVNNPGSFGTRIRMLNEKATELKLPHPFEKKVTSRKPRETTFILHPTYNEILAKPSED
jgi:hypothetical protein